MKKKKGFTPAEDTKIYLEKIKFALMQKSAVKKAAEQTGSEFPSSGAAAVKQMGSEFPSSGAAAVKQMGSEFPSSGAAAVKQIGSEFPSSGAAAVKQIGSEFPSSGAAAVKQMGWLPAFTLAEVLIALTIIGVIAAITVPAIIQRTNKQEYVTALQKTYSTLSQAAQAIIAEEGSPAGDDGWYNDRFEKFKKHLNFVKECNADNRKECMPQITRNSWSSFKNLYSGGYDGFWKGPSLVLADGSHVLFAGHGGIIIDINGEKGPNQYGRDAYMLNLEAGGIYACGWRDNPINQEKETCNPNGYPIGKSGKYCACKVLREGAMNY